MAPASTVAVEPLTVSALLDTRPPGKVSVRGAYYDGGAGPLLCEALAESLPPQCAGRWVLLSAAPAEEVVAESGVTWSDGPIVVAGALDGDRFMVEGADALEPLGEDLALVDMVTAFAQGRGDLSEVPFAAQVWLGLADTLVTELTPNELNDPAAWQIDVEPFRARTGPFTALALIAEDRDREVTVGPHNHCASPPVPPPAGLAASRRVSVQPADATSCLEWFTVDFFLSGDGTVLAITLDLYEP